MERMQATLYRHLALAGVLSLALGWVLRQPSWGYAASLGFLATCVYFWLLGRQVSRTLRVGHQPAILQVVALMLARQGIGVLVCLLALKVWGVAWVAAFLAQFIGRHWVMVAAQVDTLQSEPC